MSEIKLFTAPLGTGRYCIFDEEAQAESFCEQTGIDLRQLGTLPGSGQVATFTKDGEWLTILRMRPNDNTNAGVLALLVHECVNVVQHLMDNIDENKPSREFQARLTEEVFTNLMQAYFDGSDWLKEVV